MLKFSTISTLPQAQIIVVLSTVNIARMNAVQIKFDGRWIMSALEQYSYISNPFRNSSSIVRKIAFHYEVKYKLLSYSLPYAKIHL